MRRAIECAVVAVGLLMLAITSVVATTATTTTVFSDSLAPPFLDWSWAAVNMSYTGVAHSGTTAISMLPANEWCMYIRGTGFINTKYFTGLQYWVWRPNNSDSATDITIAFMQDGEGSSGPIPYLINTLPNGDWPENTWVQGFISFAQYGKNEVYDGWWICDDSGDSTNPMIIWDDIVLINSAVPLPPSTTPSPTPSPSPSNIDAQVVALYKTPTIGLASYTGYSNNIGSCGLYPSPDSASYPVISNVAIGNYMNSRTCGMCLQVSGFSSPPYTRMVFVDDQGLGAPGSLALASPGSEVFNMSYIAVPCDVTVAVEYLIIGTTGPLYLAIMVQNTVWPVYKVAVLVSGSWVYLTRQPTNIFSASFAKSVTYPYTIQITSVTGQVIKDTIQNPWTWGNPGGQDIAVAGNVQFTM